MKKNIEDIEVVVNGSGAAGIAIAKLLMSMGLKKVVVCDTKGAIYEGRDQRRRIESGLCNSNAFRRKSE
jgi:malate dehydrogenase (oxaloacetate-decarboxylating)